MISARITKTAILAMVMSLTLTLSSIWAEPERWVLYAMIVVILLISQRNISTTTTNTYGFGPFNCLSTQFSICHVCGAVAAYLFVL